MKKIWGKIREAIGKWGKIEELFLSCPPGSERLATVLSRKFNFEDFRLKLIIEQKTRGNKQFWQQRLKIIQES